MPMESSAASTPSVNSEISTPAPNNKSPEDTPTNVEMFFMFFYIPKVFLTMVAFGGFEGHYLATRQFTKRSSIS